MRAFRACILIAALIAALPSCRTTRPSPTVDTSGIDALLPVLDALAEDREPPEEAWQRLESTPGYAVLLASEFADAGFRKPFRLAFMPSKADELKAALAEGRYRYLDHYAGWAVKARPRLAELAARTARRLDFAALTAAALPFLPGADFDPPRVALLVFSPDGRGYDPIVIDVSLAELLPGDGLELMVAHEFHHFYRNQLKREWPDDLPGTDGVLLWALDQLQGEGIADQINVPGFLDYEGGGPLAKASERYRALLAKAPKSLAAFDKVVQKIAAGAISSEEEARQAVRRALPMSAHPTGYYMANVIIQALDRATLVRHVADPFQFIRDYNEAAAGFPLEETAPYRFSKTTMDYLSDLEARNE